MQTDGVLKSDDQKVADKNERAQTANDRKSAAIAVSIANATLYSLQEQRIQAERNLNLTIAGMQQVQTRALGIQNQLDQVRQMVFSASNATTDTKGAAHACNDYQASATHHAEEAENMHQQAVAEHKLKLADMLAKQADTRNVTQMLSQSVDHTKRRGSYLAR